MTHRLSDEHLSLPSNVLCFPPYSQYILHDGILGSNWVFSSVIRTKPIFYGAWPIMAGNLCPREYSSRRKCSESGALC